MASNFVKSGAIKVVEIIPIEFSDVIGKPLTTSDEKIQEHWKKNNRKVLNL